MKTLKYFKDIHTPEKECNSNENIDFDLTENQSSINSQSNIQETSFLDISEKVFNFSDIQTSPDNATNEFDTSFTSSIPIPSSKMSDAVSSTPICKKIINVNEEHIISIIEKPLISEEISPGYSKSTNLLIKIFGEEEIILEYDTIRKKCKENLHSKEYKAKYEKLVAHLEVKLNIKKDKFQDELKQLELAELDQNTSLNTIPSDFQSNCQYKLIINKLKYIKSIKKQLLVC